MNKIEYSGGLTNLANAIMSCQQTLSSSPPGRKNVMLIITDGRPSLPRNDPETPAETAATVAKKQGTFIIPVLIEQTREQDPSLAFMQKISSDGEVFLSDFEGLSSLQDSLLNQVSCTRLDFTGIFDR